LYLIYVDESGDPGLPGATPFFIISGLIVHESHWNDVFRRFVDLRRYLGRRYHIPQRIAFHAVDIVNGHGDFHHTQSGLTRPQRLALYREILEALAQFSQVRLLNVFVRKQSVTRPDIDVFEWGWTLFIQRFQNYLSCGGHLSKPDDCGLLFTDRTHDDPLRRLMRRMRAFNFVPSQYLGNSPRRLSVDRVLDDPIPRVSSHSYYTQMADLVAFALARRDFPRPSLLKFGFEEYFDILTPVLLKEATKYDPQGIVYWPH